MIKINGVVRDVFGRKLTYCTDPDQEKAILSMTGKKTLTADTIRGLRLLGVQVDIFDPYKREESKNV